MMKSQYFCLLILLRMQVQSVMFKKRNISFLNSTHLHLPFLPFLFFLFFSYWETLELLLYNNYVPNDIVPGCNRQVVS